MSVACCLRCVVHCSLLVVVGSLFVGDWCLLVVLCRLMPVACCVLFVCLWCVASGCLFVVVCCVFVCLFVVV